MWISSLLSLALSAEMQGGFEMLAPAFPSHSRNCSDTSFLGLLSTTLPNRFRKNPAGAHGPFIKVQGVVLSWE